MAVDLACAASPTKRHRWLITSERHGRSVTVSGVCFWCKVSRVTGPDAASRIEAALCPPSPTGRHHWSIKLGKANHVVETCDHCTTQKEYVQRPASERGAMVSELAVTRPASKVLPSGFHMEEAPA